MTSVQSVSMVIGLLLMLLYKCQGQRKDDGATGHWGEWTQPSSCSVTCGPGVSEMKRPWIPKPGFELKERSFSIKQYACMNKVQCPRNGTWSQWNSWTRCTKVCGGGTRNRIRQCTGVMFGGHECEGDKDEREDCKREPCPALPRNFNMTQCTNEANFTCASKKMCIPKKGRCDYKVQCHDGSDEIDCRIVHPGIGHVRYDLGNSAISSQSFNYNFILLFYVILSVTLIITVPFADQ